MRPGNAIVEQTATPRWGLSGLFRKFNTDNGTAPDGVAENEPAAPADRPGLLRQFVNSLEYDPRRLGIRVAELGGENSLDTTRHLLKALGNTEFVQTKLIEQSFLLDPAADLRRQIEEFSRAGSAILAAKQADVLVWGGVPGSGEPMHLYLVAPMSSDRETLGTAMPGIKLPLPAEFGGDFASLLRVVVLSAIDARTPDKRNLQSFVLAHSLAAANAALDNLPPEMTERERACLYLSYGNALAAQACRNHADGALEKSVKLLEAALAGSGGKPSDIWGWAQKQLGSVLHIAAQRTDDGDMLEKAEAALRAALEYFDGEHDGHRRPWADIHNRLGLIGYRHGYADGEVAILRQALDHFKHALEGYTRAEAPDRWAEIMSNFAQAAQIFGELEDSPDVLATAVNACRAVLEVRTPTQSMALWAKAQNNLGTALYLLGRRTENAERLEEAVIAFELALKAYEHAAMQRLAVVTIKNLERARTLRAILQAQSRVDRTDGAEAAAEPTGETIEEAAERAEELEAAGVTEEEPADALPWPGEALFKPEPGIGGEKPLKTAEQFDELPWPGEGLRQVG